MEEEPVVIIGLGILFVFALIAFFWITVRNVKLIRKARIQEEEGTLRPPTRKEKFLIAQHLANDKGKHFWHLIIAVITITAVVILVMKFFLLSRFDL